MAPQSLKKTGIFKRNKVSVRHKVKACLIYMAGLSYRSMTIMSSLTPASYVAVYYWVQKLKRVVQDCVSKVKARKAVTVDETKMKVNGEQLFVWAAIDVDSREILAVNASWQTFTYWYNNLRIHQTLGKPPSQTYLNSIAN